MYITENTIHGYFKSVTQYEHILNAIDFLYTFTGFSLEQYFHRALGLADLRVKYISRVISGTVYWWSFALRSKSLEAEELLQVMPEQVPQRKYNCIFSIFVFLCCISVIIFIFFYTHTAMHTTTLPQTPQKTCRFVSLISQKSHSAKSAHVDLSSTESFFTLRQEHLVFPYSFNVVKYVQSVLCLILILILFCVFSSGIQTISILVIACGGCI